jgi:hypothetical protein
MKKTILTLVGSSPLIMHSNYVLADPLSPITKRIKQIQKNRSKTDEEIEEAYKLEFQAGLYLDKGKVVIPADNLNAMIADAGAKVAGITRNKAGAYVFAETADLIYTPPEPGEGTLADLLWASNSPGFRLIRPVKLQGGKSTVMRSRPIFNEWAAKIELQVDDDCIDDGKVMELLVTAGKMIGLGDWRRSCRNGRFGAFEVVEAATPDRAKQLKSTLKRLSVSQQAVGVA